MAPTDAQEEFQQFVDRNNYDAEGDRNLHPEDRLAANREAAQDDLDEEDQYRAKQVNAAMRIPASKQVAGSSSGLKLPPQSFDSGCATGVKGVIADARSYEIARKATFMNRVRQARRSVFGLDDGDATVSAVNGHKSDHSSSEEDSWHDEESFLAQWRESRRRQLEDEARSGAAVRTRRTSPSLRIYGRLDTVDALGYLDAIEKVGRETVVVVFVNDDECSVSGVVEAAMQPLVGAHPTIHFVKVHYEDIEFDNAAVPAILAYRNQGDLFANLTGLIELLDEGDDFTSETLRKLLRSHRVL